MNLNELQTNFGKNPAKLYAFSNSISENVNPISYITEQFVDAAGTNLVSCVVLTIDKNWMIYTKNVQELDNRFRLVTEFPLPDPEPNLVDEETSDEETPVDGGQ
jgi:hypothetical protein